MKSRYKPANPKIFTVNPKILHQKLGIDRSIPTLMIERKAEHEEEIQG